MVNRIRQLREAKGWTLQDLADNVEPQTSPGQIHKLETGKLKLKLDWMVKIGRALGCAPEDLIAAPVDRAPLPGGEAETGPGALHHDRRNLIPVRSAARGGLDQEMYLSDGPIDFVPRPYYLANVREAYSVYMVGYSMAPMYRPGQLLYVNPHKPPRPGQGVVVTKRNNAVLIKELVRQSPDGLELREYQPKLRTFTLSATDIREFHAVVGSEEP